MKIGLQSPVTGRNDREAARNRAAFRRRGLFVFNLIGSPGTGKTSLLEAMAGEFGDAMAVIEGDVQTRRDADRIEGKGCRAVQIETHGACHLDASMVGRAAEGLFALGGEWKVLAVENVGNLICPSSYDLGENVKIGMLSLAEGDDKVLKYPSIFSRIGMLVTSKIDLLPHMDFDIDRAESECRSLNPGVSCFRVSARTGEGIPGLCSHILSEREKALRV